VKALSESKGNNIWLRLYFNDIMWQMKGAPWPAPESPGGDYGAILFQDDASLKRLLKKHNSDAGILLALGLTTMVVGISEGISKPIQVLVLFATGLFFIIVGVWAGIQKYRPFIIYEQGILCNLPKIPLMKFADMEHIEIFNWSRTTSDTTASSYMVKEGGRVIIIYMIAGQKYWLAEFGRARLDPPQFLKASEIVCKRLKETHPHEPETKLIRDVARLNRTNI
jgi:hypothetical protein